MKQISTFLFFVLFLAGNVAFGQFSPVQNDTVIVSCDSIIVNYGDTAGGTIDSVSYEFSAGIVDTGAYSGSGTKFPYDSTSVLLIGWESGIAIDSAQFYVIVRDTAAPVITKTDTTVYLDSAGGVGIDTSFVQTGIVEDCTLDSVWLSLDTFNCTEWGENSVTIYARDTAGNVGTAISTVTVADTIFPIIVAHDTTVYLDSLNGRYVLDTAMVTTSRWDNGLCLDSVWLSQDTFLVNNLDTNNVFLYMKDEAGNIDTSVVFKVIVKDSIVPSIVGKDAVLYLDSAGGVGVDTSAIYVSSWDACGVDSVWMTVDTFRCTDLDTNQVYLYARDTTGNSDSVMVEIIVKDTILPHVYASDTTVYIDSAGGVGIDTTFVLDSTWDNCNIDSVWLSNDTFNCTPLDSIYVIAMDTAGNKDSTMVYITILDSIGPHLVGMDTTVYLNSAGLVVIDTSFVIDTLWDNCGIDSVWITKDSFECNERDTNKVWIYADDSFANRDSFEVNVIVKDTIRPTVITKDTTVYLSASGSVSIDTGYVNNGSYDNCSIDSLALSDTLFNCGDTGVHDIWLYAWDSSDNLDSLVAHVTVLDTIPPLITSCPADISSLLGSVSCDTILKIDPATATDICGIDTIWWELTGANVGTGSDTINQLFDGGITNIIWTAVDSNGNSSTCNQLIDLDFKFIIANDNVSTDEDITFTFNPLTNDLDCDDDVNPATMSILDSTKVGTVELNTTTGEITYDPDLNYFGFDTLQYKVSDADGKTDSAMVYIVINSVNDQPVANDDYYSVYEDVLGNKFYVLDNDWDVENDALRLYILEGPTSGGTAHVSGSNPSYIEYSPPKNWSGNDKIKYQICDINPNIKCANAFVYITVAPVNDFPTVDNETHVIDEDNNANGDLIDAGDVDPDGSGLNAKTTPLVGPSHGTITIAADGIYTYTPALNYNGTDMVVAQVCDAGVGAPICLNDTIFITINPVNDAPVVDNDVLSIAEEGNGSGDLIDAGDSDIDGTVLTANVIPVKAPANGVFTVAADGAYTYAANADFNGTDMVVVEVCDAGIPGSLCVYDTLTVTVSAVNDTPFVANEVANISVDLFSSKTVSLANVFDDVDAGDSLRLEVKFSNDWSLPSWITFNSLTGELTVSPANDASIGSIILKVTATDNGGLTATDLFIVTVNSIYTISGMVVEREGEMGIAGSVTGGTVVGNLAANVDMVLKIGSLVVDTVQTNATGEYIFEGLEAGIYNVNVSKAGYTQDTNMVVTLNSSIPEVEDINFTIWLDHSVITNVPGLASGFEVKLYPNPTRGMVNVDFENSHSEVEVSVYNIVGAEVFRKNYIVAETIRFNLDDQTSGMYFVKLKVGENEIVKKIILDRK